MSFQIVTAADLLWDELGHQQAYYERPDLPFSDDDQIFRIRTKPGYLFDDYFWEVFQGFPSFLICHVAYYGPARPEDLPRPMQGVFELRWTTWGARRQMGRSSRHE